MEPPDPFRELLETAKADQAARDRSRARWLRQQAEEGARLAGTLLDLAERDARVSVRTVTGRTHHGVLRVVGRDFCGLLTGAGTAAFVPMRAVALVRPEPGRGAQPAADDRSSALDLSLGEVLGRLVAGRPRVAVGLGSGDLIAGELRSVGEDVLTLQPEGEARLCYVAVASVSEVVLTSG